MGHLDRHPNSATTWKGHLRRIAHESHDIWARALRSGVDTQLPSSWRWQLSERRGDLPLAHEQVNRALRIFEAEAEETL
eukprot:87195-Amphidinium_carterae.1